MGDQALNRAAEALSVGRLEEAEIHCQSLLTAEPNSAVALQLLGLIAHQREQYAEAVKYLSRSIALQPGQAVWHFNLGVSLRAAGKLNLARETYAKAIELDPACMQAHYHLGSVLLTLGEQTQALEKFNVVLKFDPNHTNACYQAGLLYREQGNIGRAVKLLRRAAQGMPDDPEVQLGLAVTLIDSGELDEARQILESLRRIHPDRHRVSTALAGIYERQGKPESAWELIEPLLDGAPAAFDAALVLADIAKKLDKEDQAIRTLKACLASDSDPDSQRMLCHFALGQLHDGQGDSDHAFEHFRQANSLNPRRFDPEQHQHHVDAIIHTFNAKRLADGPRSSHQSPRPIIIVGMPRSGTSLVEQILASHDQVAGGGELPTMPNLAGQLRRLVNSDTEPYTYPQTLNSAQLDEIASIYLAALEKVDAIATHVTDKTPGNFLYLGLIALALPGARIIHCQRDPMAACWSCYTKHFVGEHAYSYDLKHLGQYHRQYQRLMCYWRDVLPIPLHEVQYEQLVTEPETTMRGLVDFCGLDWSDACLHFHENTRRAPTASYDQVRQPIYTTAIDHWRRYESHLDPLRESLNRPAA